MRLHRLTLTAFQPFAGTETIDFDSLGEAGLFLMQGETGAGKTAILDGICFALFGRVPGARDSAPRLRSDHSRAEARTEVVLELTISGRRLRVTRSPKQERPKVRGDGLTEEPSRATLEAAAPDGTWSVLAERIEAVEHELDTLLGLTLTQFCQVVLLPQGAFARFLHAGTDERERLLAQLFDTDRYAAAQEWLGDARRDTEVEVYRGLDTVGDVASRIAQVTGEEPPEEWRSAPEELPQWLGGRLVIAEARLAAAEGRRAAAVHERDQAAERHAAAAALAQRRGQRAEATAELARREAAVERRQDVIARLERARRAAPAATLAAQLARAEAELAAIRATAEVALTEAGAGSEAPPAAQLTLEAEPLAPALTLDAAEARERAAELRQAAVLAGACVQDEAKLPSLEAALDALRVRGESASEAAQAAVLWLAGAEAERERREAAVAETRAAAVEAPGAREAAERALARAAAGRRRDALAARRAGEQTALEAARAAELDARQAWLDARQRRLDGIAFELAGELHDGDPCRVCGATEHPAPAATPAAVITADVEEALGVRAEELAGGHAAAREALASTERDLSAARALAGDEPQAVLDASAAEAESTAARLAAAAASGEAAQRALAAHAAEIARQESARAAAREELARVASEVEAAERDLASARARVADARQGCATIDARLAWLGEHAAAYERASESLERLEHARDEHERQRRAAREQALLAGFGSAEQALEAALDPEEVTRLERALEQHDEAMVRLQALVADPELVAAARAAEPDLAGCGSALEAAEAELEAAAAELTLAGSRVSALRELADELTVRLETLAPLLERRALVRGVASLADGSSAANRLRMPLSAYVLTARLEQIAEAASVRLERMSGGRYLLAHCDERVGRSRKGGLGLEVHDAWTGRERPPSSLSGGETFQASLALALGLADVVSAEAGGARLETLFVDEGFGTLGDRALDDVLDVLDGLREGGRAVGVISHVSEMRQRIPVQLHVEKGREGSRIRQR